MSASRSRRSSMSTSGHNSRRKPHAASLANLRRGGGRPKGVRNKVTVEAKRACAEIVDDPAYRAGLVRRARAGKLAPAVETMLWYYAKGKPTDTVEHRGALDFSKMSDDELKDKTRAMLQTLLRDDEIREHARTLLASNDQQP